MDVRFKIKIQKKLFEIIFFLIFHGFLTIFKTGGEFIFFKNINISRLINVQLFFYIIFYKTLKQKEKQKENKIESRQTLLKYIKKHI